jgi:hypothetical protein
MQRALELEDDIARLQVGGGGGGKHTGGTERQVKVKEEEQHEQPCDGNSKC